MPRSSDDALSSENSSMLKVRQIQQENYYKTAIVSEKAFLKMKADLEAAWNKEQERATVKQLELELQAQKQVQEKILSDRRLSEEKRLELTKKTSKESARIEKELLQARKDVEREAFEAASKLSDKLFETKSVRERARLKEQEAFALEQQKLALQTQAVEQLAQAKTAEERSNILKQFNSELAATSEAQAKARSDALDYAKKAQEADSRRLTTAENLARKEKEIQKTKEQAEKDLESAENDKAFYEELLKGASTESEKDNYSKKIQDLTGIIDRASEIIKNASTENSEELRALRNEVAEETFTKKLDEIASRSSKEDADNLHKEKQLDLNKRLADAKAKQEYKNSDEYKEDQKLEKQVEREERRANSKPVSEQLKEGFGKSFKEAAEKSIAQIGAAITDSLNQIDSNINSFFEYQAQIEARLNGTDTTYSGILSTVKQNVGISTVITQKDMIANIKKLVDSGVTFDLEQRAFLATISDKIVNTFDAFDSNLLRVIRLQQADSTAARLGMESALNELLNTAFSDSSYLNDAFDSVSSSIIDATAQMSRDASIEFEYIVQKWLGALYSLGLSQNTVSTIAQGLNYLGTGNVEALNSNESLQSLLAMSASRAGLPYADLLIKGLDASSTNALLKSMVEYLKEIAQTSNTNKVTTTSYANVFGLNITDLIAISNLQNSEINELYQQTLSSNDAMQQMISEANKISSRTHTSQKWTNVFENLMASAAEGIGTSGFLYGYWKILNVIKDLTGGIDIPAVTVAGFGVDLNTTVVDLLKLPIAGAGLLGSLIGGLGKLGSKNLLSGWNFDNYTSRGASLKRLSGGVQSGFSESNEMSATTSGSGSDIKKNTLAEGASSAEEDSKTTNASVEGDSDIYKKIYESIADEKTSVLMEVVAIHELLDKERLFKTELGGFDDLKDLLSPRRVFYSALVGALPLNGSSFSLTDNGLQVSNLESVSSYLSTNSTKSLVEVGLNNLVESSNQHRLTTISNLGALMTVLASTQPFGNNVQSSTTTTNTASSPEQLLSAAFRQALTSSSGDSESMMELFKEIRDQLKDNKNILVANDYIDDVLQKIALRN